MAWRFLSGAQMNEVIAKRLALNMALMCVRNTCIEDVHAGSIAWINMRAGRQQNGMNPET
jgi:hypothetical protein